MTYKALVDDNFHFLDESERYEFGEFPTLEAALEASRRIVDQDLVHIYQPGMTAQQLFEGYKMGGEDPFIVSSTPEDAAGLFSAWDYAKRRCEEMCSPQARSSDG